MCAGLWVWGCVSAKDAGIQVLYDRVSQWWAPKAKSKSRQDVAMDDAYEEAGQAGLDDGDAEAMIASAANEPEEEQKMLEQLGVPPVAEESNLQTGLTKDLEAMHLTSPAGKTPETKTFKDESEV